MVDKYVLILTPKNALIDWVNSVDSANPVDYHDIGGHDTADVFLLDEFDNPEEAVEWLKENYMMFFEEILVGWYEDASVWPEDLTWNTFHEFIHYSFQSIVYDLSEEGRDMEEIILN